MSKTKTAKQLNIQDIWLVELSTSITDISGHEQGETRPCLIFAKLDQVELATIIPITKTKGANRFPFTLQIPKDAMNMLDFDSTALVFQLRSLSYKRFKFKIGKIVDDQFTLLKTMVSDYLGLSSVSE